MDVARLSERAGNALQELQGKIDGLFDWFKEPGAVIAESTRAGIASINATMNDVTQVLQSGTETLASSTPSAPAAVTSPMPGSAANIPWTLQSLKNMSHIFNYLISRWSIVTLVVAIVLNRIHFYASSRNHLRLKWFVRFGMYIGPIAALSWQALCLVRALRCQMSPHWADHRYQADKRFDLDFAGEGGAIWQVAAMLLSFESESDSCQAAGLAKSPGNETVGSLSLLWPTFLSLCFSQIVEGLACTLQGVTALYETSLFEHSLAFAEAEATVLRPFEAAIAETMTGGRKANTSSKLPMSRRSVLRVMNVAPEILLVTLVSCLSSIISNILGIFGLRRKMRLANTALIGISYLSVFIWSILRTFGQGDWSVENSAEWLLRFPTVFLVGYIPYVLLIGGMIMCATIYLLAFTITVLSPPPDQPHPRTLKERALLAYRNLQAHIYLSTGQPLTIRREDDFYTAVLNMGFAFVTAASDAVYLKEGQRVVMAESTWLEQKRLKALVQQDGFLHRRTMDALPVELRSGAIRSENGLLSNPFTSQTSGYAVERKPFDTRGGDSPDPTTVVNGTGFVARTGRLYMAGRLVQGIMWLLVALLARLTLTIFQRLGLTYRPYWLRRLTVKRGRTTTFDPNSIIGTSSGTQQAWWETDRFRLNREANVDVEAELRRRLRIEGTGSKKDQKVIDNALYDWWKTGGWWGEVDNSGEYMPPQADIDNDNSSVISDAEEDADSSPSPDADLQGYSSGVQMDDEHGEDDYEPDMIDIQHLTSLLDPVSPAMREEGRMLARRLRRNGALTRSQHQRQLWHESTAVLLAGRTGDTDHNKTLTDEDEERALDDLITMSRRASKARPAQSDSTAGPLCIICQDSPRTILLWPCGHLALCDDCRINMASRNFNRCVCCRNQTAAYSRLFVP